MVKLPGTPKADVRVYIRRRIIQIQRKHSRVGCIVPITTADGGDRRFFQPNSSHVIVSVEIKVFLYTDLRVHF